MTIASRIDMSADSTLAGCEQLWVTAVQQRDLGMLGKLLHEKFLCTSWGSRGELITKAQYLAAVEQEQVSNCSVFDFAIQQTDDVAVLKCRMNCEFGDRGIRAELLITDTWVRRPDGWKALSRHASLPYEVAASLSSKFQESGVVA